MGKQGALIFIVYSVCNRRINELFQRTMTNGVESVLCSVAFYYYINLKYKGAKLVFDRNMALMTLAITMAFLIRSTSLVGWIPLSIIKIFSTKNPFANFLSICYSGIVVVIPTIALSVMLDSKFYGRLTAP